MSAPSTASLVSAPCVSVRDNVLGVGKDVAHLGYRELDEGFGVHGDGGNIYDSGGCRLGTGGAGRRC
jgi:hypothetical protein